MVHSGIQWNTVVEYYTVLELDLATRTGVLVAAICVASTPELSLECRLREFLMRVSHMKHLGHNEFPFEDVSWGHILKMAMLELETQSWSLNAVPSAQRLVNQS